MTVLTTLAAGYAIAVLLEPTTPWLAAGMPHLLGTDEFGRDVLATSLGASAVSLAKGLSVATITLALAIAVAEVITATRHRLPAIAVRGLASVVESVPPVLWVMIVLIAVREPRLIIVGAAFAIVTLPTATHIIAGEFFRLRSAPFIEAAYQLGAGEMRVLFAHMIPNAHAVIIPFGLQVLGAAIAVDGAIGVIGLGNRSDIDLGIFLLRGKENFVAHPQVLLAALAAYAALYAYLLHAGRLVKAWNEGI